MNRQMLKDIYVCFLKDFRFYFHSKIIYLLLIVYLVMTVAVTVYTTDFYINTYVSLYQFFKFQPGILAMIIPVLTMKFWSDEYKNNTLELLLSQPIDYVSIIVGKFLSSWIVVGIMMIFSMGFYFTLSRFLSLDSGHIITNYFISFLCAGGLCAVSSLAAALTYNAMSAFLLGLAFCLFIVNTSLGFLVKKFLPNNVWIMDAIKYLDFNALFNEMIMGQIGVASVVYFLMLIVMPLWLVVIVVEHNRG